MPFRILVVNDTQEILDIFRDVLEDEGYEVVLYSFAITEMAEIERINPDLIILDYIFGGEKMGWQMLQKLKMRRTTATIPILVCTAATREVRDIEGYLHAQGIVLVPKPFDLDDFLAAVQRALQMPRHAAGIVTHVEAGSQQPAHEPGQAHADGKSQGAEGSKGSKGAEGSKGSKGAEGSKGSKGAEGSKGSKGVSDSEPREDPDTQD